MNTDLTRLLLLFAFCAATACNTRAEPIRLEGFSLPEGGVISAIARVSVVNDEEVYVIADQRLFSWKKDRWHRLPDDGYLNARSQIAAFGGALFLLEPATVSSPPRLSRTENRGNSWNDVSLPIEVRSIRLAPKSGAAGSAAIRANDEIRILNRRSDLYLLHAP